VRLVKGAYWDHELVEARQHGWPAPVFEVKADCDRNFEALTRTLLDARPRVRVAIASHNLRSVAHAIAYNRLTGGDDSEVEIQVLRGLGDELQHALAANGLRVRTYCPVGDLVAGMAYLVRRLLENTSNESFLHERASGRALKELLAAP
jgi:RHH-type proline utilization regulon transcriptional repressor/proline dehydrogenase/delta 1-pyrroline-5-carboxylate dehydrogenase